MGFNSKKERKKKKLSHNCHFSEAHSNSKLKMSIIIQFISIFSLKGKCPLVNLKRFSLLSATLSQKTDLAFLTLGNGCMQVYPNWAACLNTVTPTFIWCAGIFHKWMSVRITSWKNLLLSHKYQQDNHWLRTLIAELFSLHCSKWQSIQIDSVMFINTACSSTVRRM